MPEATHGFNIAKFSAQIAKSGILQTNKFIVEMTVPTVSFFDVKDRISFNRNLSFRIEKIKLPGLNLNNVDTARYGVGPTQKFPIGIRFTETSMTIIENRQFNYWLLFNNWIQKIYHYTGTLHGRNKPSYTLEYKQKYVTDIKISIFNNEGTRDYVLPNANAKPNASNFGEIILKDAYPIAVNDMPLDWEQTNTLFKPVVNFAFTDWYFENFDQTEL